MDIVFFLSGLGVGAVLGLAASFLFTKKQAEQVRESFGRLSLEALSKSTEEFLKLAKLRMESEREMTTKELDSKKGLIDQQVEKMNVELANVSTLVKSLEKDRESKFGEITNQLKMTHEQTQALIHTTGTLREALSSTKARGQWGERMAEDVLRLAGFIENVNYLKQKTIQVGGSRPDFTFLLPKDLKLNMDVKFPWDNYMRFLDAPTEIEKQKYKNDFLRDVKARVKEITTRDYIDSAQNTVDYVLLFIPNEQVYAFIQESDRGLLDEALRAKVIFCSPMTLFAVLAVVRQAVENFSLEKTSNEILTHLGKFKEQWHLFKDQMKRVGDKIQASLNEYESMVLTRTNQLEKPLNKLEALRLQKSIHLPGEKPEEIVRAIHESPLRRNL